MRRESTVAVLNGLNVAAAFAMQLLVYRTAGISSHSDAYFASLVVPQLFGAVLAPIAAGVLVPILAPLSPGEQRRMAWALVLISAAVTGTIATVGLLSAGLWVRVAFPGLAMFDADLMTQLVRAQLVGTPLFAAATVLAALGQARGAFATVEAVNLTASVVAVLALVALMPRFGVIAAAWLATARLALQVSLLRRGLPWEGWRLPYGALRTVWARSRILVVGNAYFKSDLLVDRYLLSTASSGSLSLFAFAQSVCAAASGVIGQAWGNTAVPRLAAAHASGDLPAFKSLFRRNLLRIVLVASAALVVVVVLVPPLLSVLTSNSPSTASGSALWLLLALLGGVLVFGAAGTLISGGFYAIGDTRTPTLVSMVTFSVFVVSKVFVFQNWGLHAFCVLTTAYCAANALILAALLHVRFMAQTPPMSR